MILGILKENVGERRVALAPDAVPVLLKQGFQQVYLEQQAGATAFFSDQTYQLQGAIPADTDTVLREADVLVCIQPPSPTLLQKMKPGQVLIGQFNLLDKPAVVEQLRAADLSVFSLDLVPRTTRAQAMDVLSSMATVAGYKAVLLAATHLPGFFPMLMTAAGAIKPAKLLVLGAGVAGLQAIASARRLGAVVEAFDVRRAAKEEVLSLGARFVEVEGAQDDTKAGGYAVEQSEDFKRRQAELIHQHAIQADVVICTAQIPGKKSPLLLPEATLEQMKSGAVIVDLAAAGGGNSAWTVNNETVYRKGLCIIGDSNLPATLPRDASSMFSKNVLNFIKLLAPKGDVVFNFDDDILAGACVTHQQKVISPRLQTLLPA